MIYTVTIRTAWDAAPLRQGAAQSSATFDQVTRKAEQAAKRIFEAYNRTYDQIARRSTRFFRSEEVAFEKITKKAQQSTEKISDSYGRMFEQIERKMDRFGRSYESHSDHLVRKSEQTTRRIFDLYDRMYDQIERRQNRFIRTYDSSADHMVRKAEQTAKKVFDAYDRMYRQLEKRQPPPPPPPRTARATQAGEARVTGESSVRDQYREEERARNENLRNQLRAIEEANRAEERARRESLRDQLRAIEEANRAEARALQQAAAEARRINAQKERDAARAAREADKHFRDRIRAEQTAQDRATREQEQASRRSANASARSERQKENEARRAAREVQRINDQTRRQAEQNARILERAETQLANHRIREAERAQRAQSRAALNQIQQQRTPGGPGGPPPPGTSFGDLAAIGVFGFTVGNVLSRVTSALTSGGHAWIEYSSKIQNAKIAFTAMLGSVTLAETHLKDLQKFALQTPFRFDELVDASQRMQALGFQASEVVPILRDVGNAVAAAGGGGERLERVIKALADVRAKEKLQTQEIRQFAEAGISAYKILEEATGKSVSEIQKDVEAGRISAELFLDAFRKFSQLHFGDLMAEQSKTFTGAMSNIQDVLLQVTSTSLAGFFEQISQLAFRTQQELQKASDLGGVTVVMTEAFAELGSRAGQGFVEGVAASLANPRTWAAIAALASSQIRAEFKVIFGDALGDPDAIIPGVAIDKLFYRFSRLSPAVIGLEKVMKSLGYESLTLEKQIGNTSNALNEAAIKFSGQSKSADELTASLFPMTGALEKTNNLQNLLKDSFPKTTEQVSEQAKAYKELNAAIQLYQSQEQKIPEPEFQKSPEKLTEYAKKLQEILILEGEAIRQTEKVNVEDAFNRVVLARSDAFKALDQQIKETTAALAGPGGAQKAYNDFIASLPQGVQDAIRLTKTFEKAADSVNAITDKSKKTETELQRLTRQFEKLTANIDSFRNLGTEEFNLRFKTEALERVKSDFERILTLRRDLGIELSAPLPEPTDTEAIQEMIRSLESEKRISDAILSIREQTRRVEEAIAITRAKRTAGAVDPKKQAELLIEEDLTEQGEKRAQVLAQLEAVNARITQRVRNSKQEELDALNEVTLGYRKRQNAADASYRLELAREKILTEGQKSGSAVRQALLSEETTRRTRESNDAVESILRDEYFLKVGLIDFELEVAAARSAERVKRVKEERNIATELKLANDEISALRRRDPAAEGRAFDEHRLEVARDELSLLKEAAVLRLENSSEELVNKRRLLSVERERLDLESRISQLQDEIANGPYNESLRIQAALLEDILEIRRRDEEAIIRQNRAQLELSDATILHSEQVRAQVLEHLASQKSVTEAFGDGIISIYDRVTGLIDRGIDKLTRGLGVVNDLLKSIARQLLNRLFQRLLDAIFPPSGGGVGSSGGGLNLRGGGGGNLLSNLFGLFRPGVGGGGGTSAGGVAGNNAVAGQFINFLTGRGPNGATGGGITNPQTAQAAALASVFNQGTGGFATPTSLTSQAAAQTAIAAAVQSTGGASVAGKAAATAAGTPSLFAGLLPALGAAAPLLGLQLGSQLGGQSLLGNILGGAGGVALGGIATAALAPGLLTGLFGGSIAGVGGATASTGLGGALGGLLTGASAAFVVAPIAVALLIGAKLLARNKLRRREETARTQTINDALAQLNEILREVKSDRLDANSAIQNALQIRAQYVAAVSQLTDRKTRDHALQDVTRLDIVIAQIRGAGDAQARRQKNLARIVPEFKHGAQFYAARGLTKMPGVYDGQDDIDIKVSRGEHVAVMTPEQFARIGKHTFERAGVPSVNIDEKIKLQHGGFTSHSQSPPSGGSLFNPYGGFMAPAMSSFNPWGGSIAAASSVFNGYNGMYSGGGVSAMPTRVVNRLLNGFDHLTSTASGPAPQQPQATFSTARVSSGTRQVGTEDSKELVIEIGELVIVQDSGKIIARGVKSPEGYNAVVRVLKQTNLDRTD